MADFKKMPESEVLLHCPKDATEERERREELWYRDIRRAAHHAGVECTEEQRRAMAKEIASVHRFVYEY